MKSYPLASHLPGAGQARPGATWPSSPCLPPGTENPIHSSRVGRSPEPSSLTSKCSLRLLRSALPSPNPSQGRPASVLTSHNEVDVSPRQRRLKVFSAPFPFILHWRLIVNPFYISVFKSEL